MIKDLLLDVLFPKLCVGCGKEGKYICAKCSIFISECESLREVRPLGIGRTSTKLDGLTSLWAYEGIIKELIHAIKYQGITDIIKELISLINIDIYYSYITYVPMYLKGEKQRGFNQARLIAKELSSNNEARVINLLEKIKDTEPQMKLNQEERLENIKGSFRLKEARPLENFNKEAVRGRASILLVDDVFTTGATMQECCKVLKQAGIKKVWGFTLARTV